MIDATDAPTEGAEETAPAAGAPAQGALPLDAREARAAVPPAGDPVVGDPVVSDLAAGDLAAGEATDSGGADEMPPAGHLAADTMNRYAARTLDAAALLDADDHLAGCAGCRARLVDDAGLRATVVSLAREVAAAGRAEPDHLPYESVEAMAEERLRGAAREVADLHLEACVTCAGEVADLRAFAAAHRAARRAAATAVAANLAGEQARRLPATDAGTEMSTRHAIAAVAAARSLATSVPAADADIAPSFTLPSAPRPGGRRTGALVATVAATLAVAAGGGWLLTRGLREQVTTLTATVDQLQQEKSALASRADAAAASRAEIERQAVESARAAAAKVAVSLSDRQGKDAAITVGLDDDGQLVGLDGLRLAEARAIAVALKKGAIEVPAPVLELGRGDAAGADATGPVPRFPAGQMIRGVRPTFAWDAVEGATGYTIAVSDESGAVVLRGGPTRTVKWTPPRPLRRGALYAWTVTATLAAEPVPAPDADAPAAAASGAPPEGAGGDPAPARGAPTGAGLAARGATIVSPRARFRVLDQETATGLDRALRAAEGSHLATGVFMARAGVLDEALGELRLLAEANPQSPLAQSLLASVETAGTAR